MLRTTDLLSSLEYSEHGGGGIVQAAICRSYNCRSFLKEELYQALQFKKTVVMNIWMARLFISFRHFSVTNLAEQG
jgi:hypothetical protein